jgi:DNA-3-methyladenine glycosylase II
MRARVARPSWPCPAAGGTPVPQAKLSHYRRAGTFGANANFRYPMDYPQAKMRDAPQVRAAMMELIPCQPFDFNETLRFVLSPPRLQNGRQFEPLLDHWADGEYRRLMLVGGEPVLYGLSPAGRPGAHTLRLRIVQGGKDAATQGAVARAVQRQFKLAFDLKPFYAMARRDPVLALLSERFAGMRIPQTLSAFEAVISAILEQQVNLSFAHKVKKWLVETYGAKMEFEGCTYRAFPQPAALARATAAELRQLQISGPKARYLTGIARAVVEGSLDLEALAEREPAEALAVLTAQKGVGDWTANYVGMRALGHPDSLPAADVGLQKAVQYYYGLRKQPDAAGVEKIARAWKGWRSFGTFYLWLTYWREAPWRKQLQQEAAAARRKPKPRPARAAAAATTPVNSR